MAQITRIQNLEQLDALLTGSDGRKVWIFKHSLACPISSRAFREYQSFVEASEASGDVVYALVEIQKARPVSTAIAERTGVRHESPQALLVADGSVVWHDSHWNIRQASLARAQGA